MTNNFVDDLGFDEAGNNLYIDLIAGDQIYCTGEVKFDDRGVYAYETRPGPQNWLTFVPWSNVKRISQEQ